MDPRLAVLFCATLQPPVTLFGYYRHCLVTVSSCGEKTGFADVVA
jgi:hypothetical protein